MTMKTREQIARFIEAQLAYEIGDPCPNVGGASYGRCQLRQLMDFIFECRPLTKEEEIRSPPPEVWTT